MIAVHAGLEKKKGVEEQLKYLKARDTRIPKVEALSGRKNVWEIPEVNVRWLLKLLCCKIFLFFQHTDSDLCLVCPFIDK